MNLVLPVILFVSLSGLFACSTMERDPAAAASDDDAGVSSTPENRIGSYPDPEKIQNNQSRLA